MKDKVRMFFKKWWFFLIIIFVALVLRLSYIDSIAFYNGDEVVYTVRGMSYYDSIGSSVQTTPREWYESDPFWTKLSFHDHPPLTFFINYVFFTLFGKTLFIGRLVSILFNIGTLILIFHIINKLFNRKLAHIGMGLMAINSFLVEMSRHVMMESITIFFIVLSLYTFILFMDNKKWFYLFGISVGLSCLSKYVSFFILPVYLIIIIIYRPSYFKDYRLYLSGLLALILFLPVIIYNYYLYKNVGHFDMQFSYLFGQETPLWANQIGKEYRGSMLNRVIQWKRLYNLVSPFYLLLFVISSLSICFQIIKQKFRDSRNLLIILLLVLFIFIMTQFIGAEVRFLVYIIPFSVLVIIAFFNSGRLLKRRIIKLALFLFVLYELFFTFNTAVLSAKAQPIGKSNLFYSPFLINKSNQSLILDEYISSIEQGNNENLDNIYIMFDSRIDDGTYLWVSWKRLILENKKYYHASHYNYVVNTIEKNNEKAKIYFVYFGGSSKLKALELPANINPDDLKKFLDDKKIEKKLLYNNKGVLVYQVYEFVVDLKK